MADHFNMEIIEEATSTDLLTLDEAKLLLGLSLTDTSHDAQLTMQITIFSETIATLCNRVFAKETLTETWREVYNGRLFLSHWPVKTIDIQTVTSAGIPCDWALEERTGKLSHISPGDPITTPWDPPAVVTYTGGYDLPTEAPMPLKQACALLIMYARMRLQQAQVAGVRQISHKESRIAFFDPNAVLIRLAASMGKGAGIDPTVDALLKKYMHIEV
jgi:hypothetical protein